MFALNPITETVTGIEKNKPKNCNRNKFVTEGKNKSAELKEELVDVENCFHAKSISRLAA